MFAFLLNQILVSYYLEVDSISLSSRQEMFQCFGYHISSIS